MKYRRLTKEEFEQMAEDFAIFLASNSIDKNEWDSIKSSDSVKAENLLDIFSDMVFDKALSSGKYLERISETEVHCYYFQPKQAHLISLRNTVARSFLENGISTFKPEELELIQGTKLFGDNRESEMFKIMQTGASLSDGKLYQKLLLLL